MKQKRGNLREKKAAQFETMRMPPYYKKMDLMEDLTSAGMGHMAFAIWFGEMKGPAFVKAAADVMNAIPDDEGVDFFTAVVAHLNETILYRMHEALPGQDFASNMLGKVGG